MDYTAIRKSSLKLFIGFLSLTAVIAIVSVLSGEFGELQIKTLATCFTISAASICSMACAAFIERKKRVALGLSGILLSISAAALLIIGIWAEINNEEFWKTTATVSVFAIAFAPFLLAIPELDDRQRWIQLVSPVSISLLAGLIVVGIWGEIDNETYIRAITVVSIIVVLETLVIPILMRLRKGNEVDVGKSLTLKNVGQDLYEDPGGRLYQVREVDDEQTVSPRPEATVHPRSQRNL